jgi:hypothetical protein
VEEYRGKESGGVQREEDGRSREESRGLTVNYGK